VSVLTHEDIRRSGMTTVAELLRLIPGVHVAQINSSKWAVSVRGFGNLFSDKLLVLVDGRTAYDRLNSGSSGNRSTCRSTRSIASKSFAGPAARPGAPTRCRR